MKLAQTIGRWLRTDRDRCRPGAAGVRAFATSAGVDQAAPREGELRFVALDEVLAPHAALAERIRIAYGGAEGGFEIQITPLIRRFAAFVHLLPATRDAHFRGAGGCLHCGLEVGLHALQTADGQIFRLRRWPWSRHNARSEQWRKSIGGKRWTERVSLGLVTTVRNDEVQLLDRIDTFGDHAESVGTGLCDDRRRDARLQSLFPKSPHERPVDLQAIDGHLRQRTTVIVDRDPQTEATQFLKDDEGPVRTLDDRPTGQFELETVRF